MLEAVSPHGDDDDEEDDDDAGDTVHGRILRLITGELHSSPCGIRKLVAFITNKRPLTQINRQNRPRLSYAPANSSFTSRPRPPSSHV